MYDHHTNPREEYRRPVRQRLLRSISENMGVGDFVTRWWWGGDPDERNKVSGMSLRDVHNVQKSWAVIQANSNGNGFLMFFRLFEAEPETKLFFKNLAHIHTEAEMSANVSFRAHIINIMSSFDTSIQNLDKPELVVAWMQKLGDSHRRHRIEKRHFHVFKDVLVTILQKDLKLDPQVVASWDRYVEFIYEHLLSRLAS
uniref:SFRICE_012298 n=1 Tax=Spodoptera frugiperda TaxID=7108 RepID=A0A2H1VU60_SPOFR